MRGRAQAVHLSLKRPRSAATFCIAHDPSLHLNLHVPELDPPAFAFEADVALRYLAVREFAHHGAVHPDREARPAAGDLVGVSLARGLDALPRPLAGEVEALRLALEQRVVD